MIARDLLKTDGIIKIAADETLASAVSKLHSSHDAAFVFDGDHYVGIVNPYYSLIKHSSFNGDSLVKNALFHPPRISPDEPVERIVGLMIDSRLHYLPVLDGKQFLGIVSARRILMQSAKSDVFQKRVLEAIQRKNKPLVSVYSEDPISKVVNLFESEDVSKLVVIDKKMKLQGIMSYYDLIPHLLAPKDKSRGMEDRSGNDIDPFVNLKVKNVAKTLVHTLTPDALVLDALVDIVKREIGSVVVQNREGFPAGIITVRDLLGFLTRAEAETVIELTTNDLSDSSMQIIQDYGVHLERWVKKIPNVARANLLVKEEKNGGLFKVKFTLISKDGSSLVSPEGKELSTMYSAEGKNLLEVLKKINKNN